MVGEGHGLKHTLLSGFESFCVVFNPPHVQPLVHQVAWQAIASEKGGEAHGVDIVQFGPPEHLDYPIRPPHTWANELGDGEQNMAFVDTLIDP